MDLVNFIKLQRPGGNISSVSMSTSLLRISKALQHLQREHPGDEEHDGLCLRNGFIWPSSEADCLPGSNPFDSLT